MLADSIGINHAIDNETQAITGRTAEDEVLDIGELPQMA